MAERFKACAVGGCNGNADWTAKGGRGWCVAHYTRWLRHGDPCAGRVTPGSCLSWLRDHVDHGGDECLTWPYAIDSGTGYGKVQFRGKMIAASRAMCILAHGDPPEDTDEAAHSCGKGHLACTNPRHLRWATKAENFADQITHGTRGVGEKNAIAKLTAEAVREIRALAGTISHEAIAARYGIDRSHASLIIRRGTWKHLD